MKYVFFIALMTISIVLANPVTADDISAKIKIKLSSQETYGSGNASLVVYFKYPGAAKFQRHFISKPINIRKGSVEPINVEILIQDNASVSALTGKVAYSGRPDLFIPIEIFEFSQRPDLVTFTTALVSSNFDALRQSFPFSKYNCNERVSVDDLNAVVLASRAILLESSIYFVGTDNQRCLRDFLTENAKILNFVAPEKIRDVLYFLSNFRVSLQEDPSKAFLEIYQDFLTEVINLNTLGTRLTVEQKIGDHIRSELTEIYSKFGTSVAHRSQKTLESLYFANAYQICLEASSALFRSLDEDYFANLREIANKKAIGNVEDFEFDALKFAMTQSYDCAYQKYSRVSNPSGLVTDWVVEQHRDYATAFISLYDKLDAAGLILQSDMFKDRQIKRMTSIYNDFSTTIEKKNF